MPKRSDPSSAWPANAIDQVPVASLIPYARNARTHSDEQVSQIAASIREWGFTTPILRDETGLVIAGHGRLAAAQRLGLETVPVITARGWSEAKKRAYAIADNKLALNAGWNDELLALELKDIQAMDVDLGLLGFDLSDLDGLLDFDAPDEQPEADRDPDGSRPGASGQPSAAGPSVRFEPSLTPTLESRDYTDADVRKEDDRLQSRFEQPRKPAYRVVCPECGTDFHIDV